MIERPSRIWRPYMPGYGTLPESEGTGLLPWSWAEDRLIASRNYWMVTVWPDGGPHAMPVWGMWHEGTQKDLETLLAIERLPCRIAQVMTSANKKLIRSWRVVATAGKVY